ncbi:MAG: hypothetical protein M3Q12_09005, partial [Pseudomonadota bacterium]|nr:hypothetical protein [Pseudomonadota bacterium]
MAVLRYHFDSYTPFIDEGYNPTSIQTGAPWHLPLFRGPGFSRNDRHLFWRWHWGLHHRVGSLLARLGKQV